MAPKCFYSKCHIMQGCSPTCWLQVSQHWAGGSPDRSMQQASVPQRVGPVTSLACRSACGAQSDGLLMAQPGRGPGCSCLLTDAEAAEPGGTPASLKGAWEEHAAALRVPAYAWHATGKQNSNAAGQPHALCPAGTLTAAVSPPDSSRAGCSLHMPGMLQASRNAMLQTRPVLSALQALSRTAGTSPHCSGLAEAALPPLPARCEQADCCLQPLWAVQIRQVWPTGKCGPCFGVLRLCTLPPSSPLCLRVGF